MYVVKAYGTVGSELFEVTFPDAALSVREQNRFHGRQVWKRTIGSTLLLKGLEADHVVVTNVDTLNINNLYVALTRGAKTITVCTRHRTIQPN